MPCRHTPALSKEIEGRHYDDAPVQPVNLPDALKHSRAITLIETDGWCVRPCFNVKTCKFEKTRFVSSEEFQGLPVTSLTLARIKVESIGFSRYAKAR
jgi:hypothetical protein